MKLKKILASILCLAMVLSPMGTIAFADNTEADVWDGTVDTSWYNAADTEFTITTAEQWAGLAYLVNGAQSFNPALDNDATADFGYYAGEPDGNKSAKPDATAAENSISFEGKTIYLAADLDLCPVDVNGNLVKLPGNEQLSMMPVGYSRYTPFKGTFDGQGHTIKNLFQGGWDLYGLYYNNSVNLGLFGNVEDATIKNLVIDNFGFNAEMTLGGVAGKSRGTSVFDGITVVNSTIATGGGWQVGGLVGHVYGKQTIKNVTIDESVTIAQNGGNYDTAVGGIVGCRNDDCESIAFINCDVACKLDVYNDCTASYDTGVYRNCGMVIGAVGEDNEVLIDGKKYSDFKAKGLTFDNVNVTLGEWANYTYCWSYALAHNCQRIEPGVGYKGVNVSTLDDYSITSRPFDALFGAENAGDLSNVRGEVDVKVLEFLTANGLLKDADITVKDKAYIARTEAELYKPADVVLLSDGETEWVLVDSYATLKEALAAAQTGYKVKLVKDIEIDQVNTDKNGTNWNGDYSFLINIPVELTLDLNGCKIEATGGSTLSAPFAVIVNDKGLTIEDSSEEKTGAIVLHASEYSKVWLSSVIYNRSSLTLNGGALINKLDDTDAYAIDNTTVSKGVSFTMNGGTVASDYDTALRVGSQGSSGTLRVDINDGTVDGGIWVPLKNGGKDVVKLSIDGGTITANANGDSLVIENYAAASEGAEDDVLSITKGVFEGRVGIGETYVSEVITEGFISGGTFSNDVDEYCVTGFKCEGDKDYYFIIPETEFLVTFNPIGGECKVSFVITNDGKLTDLPTATRAGYTFDGWYLPDGITKLTTSIVFTANVTVTAKWTEIPSNDSENNSGLDYDYWYRALMMLYNQQFDVTASAADGGTITHAGISKVKYDKKITYTITPDEGYAIADVLVNGKSVGAVSEYTIRRITKDQTIHAIFVKTASETPSTNE